jgi:hypothetical protein
MKPARFSVFLLLFAASHLQVATAQTPPVGSGTIQVHVTRAGQPAANATVCVGVTTDLNQYHQGATNAQGNVTFNVIPPMPFVVTAHLGTRGRQQAFSSQFGVAPPVLPVTLALPESGGPVCPSTPAGPQRTLVPRDLELPNRVEIPHSITLQHTEFCFGALGAACGQPQTGIPGSALCASGHCFVNSGSWEHDECCFDHPHGMACQAGPLDAVTGNDGHCVASWNKAVRLAGKGLNWLRNVDFSRGNTTGTVEFTLYCAPANTLVPASDGAVCCSRDTRGLNAGELAAAAATLENLRACR